MTAAMVLDWIMPALVASLGFYAGYGYGFQRAGIWMNAHWGATLRELNENWATQCQKMNREWAAFCGVEKPPAPKEDPPS